MGRFRCEVMIKYFVDVKADDAVDAEQKLGEIIKDRKNAAEILKQDPNSSLRIWSIFRTNTKDPVQG